MIAKIRGLSMLYLKERGVERGSVRRSSFERTREGHHQSDERSNVQVEFRRKIKYSTDNLTAGPVVCSPDTRSSGLQSGRNRD